MKSLKEAKIVIDSQNAQIEGLKEIVFSLECRLESLESAPIARDRGPKSTKDMTEDDARRIMVGGDLEKVSHKSAATTLGLSYGQVYSCRGGYTFKKLQPHA